MTDDLTNDGRLDPERDVLADLKAHGDRVRARIEAERAIIEVGGHPLQVRPEQADDLVGAAFAQTLGEAAASAPPTAPFVHILYKRTHQVHSVRAAGSAEDGSLYGFWTACGMQITDDTTAPESKWDEQGDRDLTCGDCRRHEQAVRAWETSPEGQAERAAQEAEVAAAVEAMFARPRTSLLDQDRLEERLTSALEREPNDEPPPPQDYTWTIEVFVSGDGSGVEVSADGSQSSFPINRVGDNPYAHRWEVQDGLTMQEWQVDSLEEGIGIAARELARRHLEGDDGAAAAEAADERRRDR